MGHCREIASTDRVVEQFASSRDSTIRVIGLSGFLGGALGGCGGGWGGRGGGGGGVHSFFGVENCPKKTASSQNTKDLKNLVRLGSD